MKIELNTDFMSKETAECLAKDFLAIEKTAEARPEIDKDRAYHVLYTNYLMKSITENCDGAEVSCELFQPFDSSGCVSVVADSFEFEKEELLAKAVVLANNFSIYQLANGKIKMDFGFHGLVKS